MNVFVLTLFFATVAEPITQEFATQEGCYEQLFLLSKSIDTPAANGSCVAVISGIDGRNTAYFSTKK